MSTIPETTICCDIIKKCMKSIGNLSDDNISCDDFRKMPFDASMLPETAKTQLVNCILNKIKELGGKTILSENDLKDFKTVGELCKFVDDNQEG